MEEVLVNDKVRSKDALSKIVALSMSVGSPWSGEPVK